MGIISLLIAGILVNNYIFVKFLGVCSFLGCSDQLDTAVGMGIAVTFVMTAASAVTWLVQHYILNVFNIGYMQTVTFILVVAALVQFVEMVIKKVSPTLYRALGVYLPLITTNCAVLGCAVLNIQQDYNFFFSMVSGFSYALGYFLAIVLMAGVREKLAFSSIPNSLKGFPITLIITGLMAVSFYGFQGLFQEFLTL